MKKWLMAGLTAGVILLVPSAQASAQTTVANCEPTIGAGYTVGPNQEVGEGFTVTDDVTVEAIRLRLGNPFAVGGEYVVRIVTLDGTGKPSTTVLAQGTLPLADANSPAEVETINFASPAALITGTQYAFTISKTETGDATAEGSTGDACAGGTAFFRIPAGSGAWSVDANSDYWFQLLGDPTPPPDADGDGIPDSLDGCPTVAGPASNNGCPVTTTPPDTDAPETTITRGPRDETQKPKAKFKFTSDEAGSSFECRLKGRGLSAEVKRFGPCGSPRRYRGLEPGKYRFAVRAKDAAGNVDPTPATDRFKVVAG